MKDDAKKARVKCDLCDWKQPVSFDDIPEWHNKKCPQCNRGIIINDDEIRYWRTMKALLDIQDILDPNGEQPRQTVHFDSSPTRKGKAPEIKIEG